MKFSAQADAFENFLKTVPFRDFPPPPRDKGAIGVLISAWLQTSVPWFTAALGLLERAAQSDVFFIFDDTTFPNDLDPPYQIEAINRVMNALQGQIEVVRLSETPTEAITEEDEAEVERLTGLHMVSTLKNSFAAQPRSEIADQCRIALRARMESLKHLFATRDIDHCISPGGIYAASGLMRYLGRKYQRRVAFYDSGEGSVSIGVDDVSAYGMDIAKMFEPRYADFVAQHKERALTLAKDELNLRMEARDRYSYQGHAYEEDRREKCDILIPLSIFDDASGLGKTTFFPTPDDWLLETVPFVLEQTAATLVVREHPAARLLQRTEHLGGLLTGRFGQNERFRFVSCQEKLSTYNLLETARLILPCASTVGIEAAALGKKVILESSVYYSGMKFVERAVSKEDYFARIKRQLESPTEVSEDAREQAWLCYFFSQVGSYVDSDFTPTQMDFPKWVRRSFRKLAADRKVRLIVDSIRLGIPSSRLQSEQIFSTDPETKRTLWQRLTG